MGLICNCPRAAALSNVPISDCPSQFGQLQKVIFQRVFKTGATKNEFVVATANPTSLASWTPLLAALDGTKVVQSPYLQAPTPEVGKVIEYGGGNDTLGGIPIIIGREPTAITANILNTAQVTIKALKDYQCENVGVYLVDENGKIGAIADNVTTPTKISPIPIRSLFVGDLKLGGINEPDMNVVSWKFLPNWSDNLVYLTPTDFNALTDLVNP